MWLVVVSTIGRWYIPSEVSFIYTDTVMNHSGATLIPHSTGDEVVCAVLIHVSYQGDLHLLYRHSFSMKQTSIFPMLQSIPLWKLLTLRVRG